MTARHVFLGLLLACVFATSPALAQSASQAGPPCSNADGTCDAGTSGTHGTDMPARPRSVDGDSLWEGALLGGAVGAGYGVVGALLSDCPRGSARSCGGDRAALVALSTALGAGIGLAIDAISRPELTGAPLPGPPASERRMGLPPPSSRGAGVRFKLAW